jgi:hypothetical protein
MPTPSGSLAFLRQTGRKARTIRTNWLTPSKPSPKGAGIAHERRLLGCRLLEIPEHLAREARFCDLAMVRLRGPDASEQDIAEQLVSESGRPILVLPEGPNRSLPTSLDNVAVAWDFSPPAARAVADALLFLRRAKRVRVFTVIDDKPIDKSHSVCAVGEASHATRCRSGFGRRQVQRALHWTGLQ